jgi:hypothetical protein
MENLEKAAKIARQAALVKESSLLQVGEGIGEGD